MSIPRALEPEDRLRSAERRTHPMSIPRALEPADRLRARLPAARRGWV